MYLYEKSKVKWKTLMSVITNVNRDEKVGSDGNGKADKAKRFWYFLEF